MFLLSFCTGAAGLSFFFDSYVADKLPVIVEVGDSLLPGFQDKAKVLFSSLCGCMDFVKFTAQFRACLLFFRMCQSIEGFLCLVESRII